MSTDYTGFLDTNIPDIDNQEAPRVSLGTFESTDSSRETSTNSNQSSYIDENRSIFANDDLDRVHDDHHETLFEDIKDVFNNVSPLASVLEGVETSTESIVQHKYARLAQASYDHFNGKDVEVGLKNTRYGYIKDLKSFKVDKELSTADNVVLHNPITKETCISFRGTTDDFSRTKSFFSDWKTNSKIALNPKSAENTKRFKQAFTDTEKTIEKYGKENLTVSGHSQGGNLSSLIGQRYDIESHSFQPAISVRQVNMNRVLESPTMTSQNIYRSYLDPVSPLSMDRNIRKNFNVTNVATNPEVKDGLIGTHSLQQFTPEVNAITHGAVEVERKTLVSSVKSGLGPALNIIGTGYAIEQDMKDDLKTGTAIQKTGKSAISAASEVEQSLFDGEVAEGSLALAGETFGGSLIVGAGIIIAHNIAVSHLAQSAKHEFTSITNKVGRWFKKIF